MFDPNEELAQDYLADCSEYLTTIETELLAIDMGSWEDCENRLDRIFRALHSIWGGSSVFALSNIGKLAMQMRDLLALVRLNTALLIPERVRVLLVATHRLSELLQDPSGSDETDITDMLSMIRHAGSNGLTESSAEPAFARKRAKSDGELRILLAEDDLACRLLLQGFLSRYGECHVAVNGTEAVDAFRTAMEDGRGYDLVCMDIMMPEMDGREAVRLIRAIEEARGILSTFGTKIIMTTTVNQIKEVIRCFKELCDAYLTKPIDLTELLRQMKLCYLIQ